MINEENTPPVDGGGGGGRGQAVSTASDCGANAPNLNVQAVLQQCVNVADQLNVEMSCRFNETTTTVGEIY